jgi:hypothetical protein
MSDYSNHQANTPGAPRPQQVDLWVRMVHVCVGTAACPWTADFTPCAPQAKFYRFVPFSLKKEFFIV